MTRTVKGDITIVENGSGVKLMVKLEEIISQFQIHLKDSSVPSWGDADTTIARVMMDLFEDGESWKGLSWKARLKFYGPRPPEIVGERHHVAFSWIGGGYNNVYVSDPSDIEEIRTRAEYGTSFRVDVSSIQNGKQARDFIYINDALSR